MKTFKQFLKEQYILHHMRTPYVRTPYSEYDIKGNINSKKGKKKKKSKKHFDSEFFNQYMMQHNVTQQ